MGWVQGKFAESFVGRLATSNDTRTTALGGAAAAILASAVDWSKLMEGDQTQVGLAAGAAIAFLFGYFTNKTKPNA